VPEGVETLVHQADGADRGHNTEREGKEALAGVSRGSIGQMGVVEVGDEVADGTAIVEDVPVSRMGAFEVEVGLERPSEAVHGSLQFGWSYRSISIEYLRSVSRTERVYSGLRAMWRW